MGVAIDWGSGTLALNLCVRRKVGKRERKETHRGIIKKFNQWDHVWTPREIGFVEAHRQRCRRHTWDGLRYWRTGLVGWLLQRAGVGWLVRRRRHSDSLPAQVGNGVDHSPEG